MNIRIWKAYASEHVSVVTARHQRKIDYRDKLKEKFKYNKEIKKISRHRHLPKYIYNAKQKKHIAKQPKYKKLKNMQLNNPSDAKVVNERKDKIVEAIE